MPSNEVRDLKNRLAEMEGVLMAIRQGEVDAVVVNGGKGDQVYTLTGADRPYRMMVEAMSEGAFTVMPDGMVLYANSRLAKMARIPLHQIIGNSWHQLFSPEEHPKFEQLLAQARHRATRAESRLHDRQGVSLAVNISVSAAELEDTRVFAVLLTDISEQKSAEEALRRMNETLESRVKERTAELAGAKSDLEKYARELEKRVADRTAKLNEMVADLEHFSYTITHDMRAPLRAMQGFGQILMDECADCLTPERRGYIERITESASRMDNLIIDALNYAKVVRQHLPLEPVNADTLLRGMLQVYPQFQPPLAQIRIEGTIPPILGNEAALTQCFSNLVSNAVKFVPPGKLPVVRIWAEERMRDKMPMVRIWFEDNGIGISKEHQKQIFQMFTRLSKDFEGTGIGLALVRKVIDRMNGALGVESEPDQGSRFWIELHRA